MSKLEDVRHVKRKLRQVWREAQQVDLSQGKPSNIRHFNRLDTEWWALLRKLPLGERPAWWGKTYKSGPPHKLPARKVKVDTWEGNKQRRYRERRKERA